MTLLSAKGFGKSHGAHVCFEEVSFTVASGARIGLIGPNGCGKTTFLRALEGATDYDGLLTRRRGLEIARLEQNPVFAAGDTPRSALAAATERWRQAERDLDARRASLATLQGDELADAIEALAELEARHEAGGGESMERRAETLLHGVGLAPAQFDQPVATLSGGERCRVALARLLIHEPDLWLLDEPTNHLDLAGIAFLERFLKASRAAVILVSHDRRLLDRIATEIWNFENGHIDRYPGNYTQSRALREQKRLVQWREWEKQRDFVKKQEWFINKWRAGTRSRQAQSRMKRLAKVERIDQPENEARLAALDLKLSRRLGDLVLETRGLTVGFPGRTLFSGLDLTLVPGEILGIVGPNGAGKSSFLRVVEGELAPLSGNFRLGPTVVPGRLGQHETFPDENRTPQQFLQDANLGADDQDRRDKLGAMLFSGDAAQRPIRALSGGEKKRLMLTRLLLEGHNVLFLDEPTNHLDVQSSEAVTLALSAYEGTVVTVSHDRYFLDEVADRILWLEDGSWRVTPGGFAEAEKARDRARSVTAEKEKGNASARPRPAAVSVPPETAADAAERPYRSWKTSKIEQHITRAEARREEINASFADPGIYRDGGRMRALTAELARIQAELAALEHEYGYR